ncbi:MFS transporter [Roseovarius sp.]|uniref:MFS transporter n=1 Tax=Roseovarius sp. TaxID=1486281 RepID=UPI003BACDB3D
MTEPKTAEPTTTPETLPLMIALAAATLTASLGISIASVLLPTLSQEIGVTVTAVQWVVLAYLMSITVAVVSAGRLGDLFGHRRVLLAGLVLFIAASGLCAVAPGFGLLIAGRALQGFGGAILIALPMSLARDLVPETRLGAAMGLIATTSAAGTALGPSLGGVLLAWGDWRMAFWALAGCGAVSLLLCLAGIERVPGRAGVTLRALDLPGTAVLMVALSAYALATSGAGLALSPAVLLALAVVALAVFAGIERRAAAPLVPLELLADRRTGAAVIMHVAVGTVMMATLVVGPFHLAFGLGLNAALVGLVMAVGPAVATLAGVPAGRLTDRLGAARVLRIGLGQMVVGLLCLAFLPRVFGVSGYVAALILLTPSFQMFLAANNTGVLARAAPAERGRLSGLLGLARNLGLMTGASVMPALFAFVLGTGDAAGAPAEQVARAFSASFAVAAGLVAVTLGLAVVSLRGAGDVARDHAI